MRRLYAGAMIPAEHPQKKQGERALRPKAIILLIFGTIAAFYWSFRIYSDFVERSDHKIHVATAGWRSVPIRDVKWDVNKGPIPAARAITVTYTYSVDGRDYVSSSLDPKRSIFRFRPRWLGSERARLALTREQAWYDPAKPESSVLFLLKESPFER